MNTEEVLEQVRVELEKITGLYPPYHSVYEGLALIEEEYEDLRNEVFNSSKVCHPIRKLEGGPCLRHEAIQIAARAIRFARDLT